MDNIIEQIPLLDSENTWIVKIFAIIFFALLFDFLQKKVLSRLQKQLEKTPSNWDDAFVHAVIAPLSLLIWMIGISLAMQIAKLDMATMIRAVSVVICVAWTLIRFIGYVEKNILRNNKVRGKKIDQTTAGAITQLLRVSVIITTTLVVLQTMGFNISAVLAFGGIGGIAVGFAAKDLLANFFGGLMIFLDRPFAIGDWVRSPDRNIEGTVEKIGWRLTVIRTFDKRPLYIPNSTFASISVENPSRMTHRRIYETIGVRYEDSKQLEDIVNDVKAMLTEHPEIDHEQTMIVNFNEFSSSSLDFFIYTFTKTTNWIKYHEVKQDVLFKVAEIIDSHNAEIAFPTSTIHLNNESAQLLPEAVQHGSKST